MREITRRHREPAWGGASRRLRAHTFLMRKKMQSIVRSQASWQGKTREDGRVPSSWLGHGAVRVGTRLCGRVGCRHPYRALLVALAAAGAAEDGTEAGPGLVHASLVSLGHFAEHECGVLLGLLLLVDHLELGVAPRRVGLVLDLQRATHQTREAVMSSTAWVRAALPRACSGGEGVPPRSLRS